MPKRSWCLFLLCFLCLPFAITAAAATDASQTPTITEKVAGAKKFPGYFNLY